MWIRGRRIPMQKGIRHSIRTMVRNEPNGELNQLTIGIEVFVVQKLENRFCKFEIPRYRSKFVTKS